MGELIKRNGYVVLSVGIKQDCRHGLILIQVSLAEATLTPVLLAITPLLAVTALVPWLCYRKMARASIVERLRVGE